jgi:hypothetical protein
MSMTLHDFTWTPRSTLPLAASVVTGAWGILAALVAGVAHLLGGEVVASSAGTLAGVLFGVVVGLLVLAAFVGCIVERPIHAVPRRPRAAVPASRPTA